MVAKLQSFKEAHPWFGSQIGSFLNYIFLGKIVQRNVSGIILRREEAIAS